MDHSQRSRVDDQCVGKQQSTSVDLAHVLLLAAMVAVGSSSITALAVVNSSLCYHHTDLIAEQPHQQHEHIARGSSSSSSLDTFANIYNSNGRRADASPRYGGARRVIRNTALERETRGVNQLDSFSAYPSMPRDYLASAPHRRAESQQNLAYDKMSVSRRSVAYSSPSSPWSNHTYHCNPIDLASIERLLALSTSGYQTPPNSTNCCSGWPGITCNDHDRLISIDVVNVCGTLPSIIRAPFLQSIAIRSGCLIGTLPREWSNMTGLQELYLYRTSISGTLPAEWANMRSMQIMYLYQTALSGTLPPEWGNMPSLQKLDLSQTSINGSLPPEWGNLPYAQYLSFFETSISGTLPPEWANMANMQTMNLYQTAISGTLPPEWGNMASIQTIYLYQTAISGTLPPEWGNMASMQKLDLAVASINGTLPPEWGSMASMQELSLSFTSINGTLPPEWGEMASLQELDLSMTSVSGTLPREWVNMTNLLKLYLAAMPISGSLPAEWGGMKNLILLLAFRTAVRGSLPPEWGNIGTLQHVELHETAISGTLPAEWGTLSSLEVLYLSQTSISGTLPREWATMSGLQQLHLFQTPIEGTLPPEWGSLSSLEVLYMSQTSISGTLPREWSNMSGLEALLLFQTSIGGKLPSEWANMTKMVQLDVSNTLLEGNFPVGFLKGMVDLHRISIASTFVSGILPDHIPKNLVTLDVSGCHFSGAVPCVRNLSHGGLFLYADRNSLIDSFPTSGPCSYRGISIAYASITSLPHNFSAIFPNHSYLGIAGLGLSELPQISDVNEIIVDASDNLLDLSSLNQSFSNPQSLDFTPRVAQQAINFSTLCRGNCSVTGPYTAQRTACSSASSSPFLCVHANQRLNFEYNVKEFAEGNFLSPVTVGIKDLTATFGSGFIDLTCPVIASAILVPSLQSQPSTSPAPPWNHVPISFPSSGINVLHFSGMQTAQLFHGVQYRLDTSVVIFGPALDSSGTCEKLPFTYSASTKSFTRAPCSAGLLGLNFTQQCVACPPSASCKNTLILQPLEPMSGGLHLTCCRSIHARREHTDGTQRVIVLESVRSALLDLRDPSVACAWTDMVELHLATAYPAIRPR